MRWNKVEKIVFGIFVLLLVSQPGYPVDLGAHLLEDGRRCVLCLLLSIWSDMNEYTRSRAHLWIPAF